MSNNMTVQANVISLGEVNLKALSKNIIDSADAPGNSDAFVKEIIWFIIHKIFVGCNRCHADAPCKMGTPLLGCGNRNAKIMVLGEAPGELEDQLRQPFVGPAGLQLQAVLEAYDLSLERGLYLSYALICRPTEMAGDSTIVGRKPTRLELDRCKPRLLAEIALVEPSVIICLGEVARKALTGRDDKVADVLGLVETITYCNWKGEHTEASMLTTYQPSDLLSVKSGKAKDKMEAGIEWTFTKAKEIRDGGMPETKRPVMKSKRRRIHY